MSEPVERRHELDLEPEMAAYGIHGTGGKQNQTHVGCLIFLKDEGGGFVHRERGSPNTMKTTCSFFTRVLLVLLTVGTTLSGADFITLNVKLKTESEDHDPHQQHHKWLEVRVTNGSADSLEGATLRWKLFAEEVGQRHHPIVIEKKGEEKLTVNGSGQFADLTTPKVTFKWTLGHSVRTGRRSSRYEPETGRRYHGYIIEVVKDGKVIAESLSAESLRNIEKTSEKTKSPDSK